MQAERGDGSAATARHYKDDPGLARTTDFTQRLRIFQVKFLINSL